MKNIPRTEGPFGWGICGPLWLCRRRGKWGSVVKNLELHACGLHTRAVGTRGKAMSTGVVRPRSISLDVEKACRMGG